VRRAVAGRDVPVLTLAERRMAVVELTRRGLSKAEIAVRIGCSGRTVGRHRRAARLEAAGVNGRSRHSVSSDAVEEC
jgi:DNA-binding CsgD family transcriptional regulator